MSKHFAHTVRSFVFTRTLFFAVVFFALPLFAQASTIVSFTTMGTTTWTAPPGITSASYLVVAGGGSGSAAGGGGAGGMLTGTLSVTSGNSYTVVVGAGGANTGNNNGSNSAFSSVTAIGGGYGAGTPAGGGSGGGSYTGAGAAGTSGQGHAGGAGTGAYYPTYYGGGGGGAGASGASNSGASSGAGGVGLQSSISGTPTYYAGGGGGTATFYDGTYISGSLGGLGGGGDGTVSSGGNGVANTGGGGAYEANGGSGIVIISYAPSITINANVFAKGTFSIAGSVSKGAGTFAIDDPLDPANKILFHSFVESPDAMNEYDGIAALDGNGEAVILLPDYFEALNMNFTYQFFPMNASMPNLYIKRKIQNNWFTIAGGTPGGEVSWMVTGVRHDPYILAHPIVPEVEKGPGQLVDKGQCIFQPLCN